MKECRWVFWNTSS